jgi:hypothetical protein
MAFATRRSVEPFQLPGNAVRAVMRTRVRCLQVASLSPSDPAHSCSVMRLIPDAVAWRCECATVRILLAPTHRQVKGGQGKPSWSRRAEAASRA